MKFEYEEQKDSTPLPVAFIDTDGDLIFNCANDANNSLVFINKNGYGDSSNNIDFEEHLKERSVKSFYKGDKLTITF
jgi:hypothetical protein